MPWFESFNVCPNSCKEGFKRGCGLFIGLDECFLKGYFGGKSLFVLGHDARNHNFVILYAIVDVENKDN